MIEVWGSSSAAGGILEPASLPSLPAQLLGGCPCSLTSAPLAPLLTAGAAGPRCLLASGWVVSEELLSLWPDWLHCLGSAREGKTLPKMLTLFLGPVGDAILAAGDPLLHTAVSIVDNPWQSYECNQLELEDEDSYLLNSCFNKQPRALWGSSSSCLQHHWAARRAVG